MHIVKQIKFRGVRTGSQSYIMDLGLAKQQQVSRVLSVYACTVFLRITSLSVVAAFQEKLLPLATDKSCSGVHPILEFGFHSLSVVTAFGRVAGSFIDYTDHNSMGGPNFQQNWSAGPKFP